MSCTKIEDEIVCIGDDSFHCPNCGKVYNDEKYTDRINRNKSGYTRVYCECGKAFNLFVDTFGIYHGVMTFKQIIEKYKQKRALIDTMRGDGKEKQTCKNCKFNNEQYCTVGTHYAEKGLNKICYEGELWEGK